jgi:hypothetical protein
MTPHGALHGALSIAVILEIDLLRLRDSSIDNA